jgi:hypothetical protein
VKRKEAAATAKAFYAYLIGRAADVKKAAAAKSSPPGLEDGSEIQIVAEGKVAAIVSAVPLEIYGEGRFEERLGNPTWTANKVMRHQAVAEFFSEENPIIPLRFGVMYSSLEKVQAMLRDRADALSAALDRVEGCEEWALNVFVDKAVLAGELSSLSPKLAELKERASKASQGQAYLLEKQAEKLRASEMKNYLKQAANEIAEQLEPQADGLKRMPVSEAEMKQEPAVAGKLVYLVKKTKMRAFRTAAEKLAAKHAGSGFKLELTGPWPPYNFVE